MADAIVSNDVLEIKTIVVKKPTEVRPSSAKTPSGSLLSPSPADLTAPSEPALAKSGTQSATRNIQNSPEGETRFSLASAAGVPESRLNDPKVVERAKKEWEEKGTESPFFKKWFGDSKVVDKDGKPLVVYHATKAAFTSFDPAKSGARSDAPESTFFFTDRKDVANSYTVKKQGNWITELYDGANIMPVYLSVKKPLRVNAKGENWQDILYRGKYYTTNELAEYAKKSGKYDGLIVNNIIDTGYGNVDYKDKKYGSTYVVFEPTQIKSAIGNRGTFDEANPDIRYSLSAADRAITYNAPEYRIYTAVRDFFKAAGAVGTIDEAYRKYDKILNNDKKLKRGHRPELDTLAERLSEDPDIAHLIGDDINAGERAVEIASKYDRLTDAQKVEKGRAAKNGGDGRSAEDLDAEREAWENSDEGRKEINEDFNHELERFTPENASSKIFNLGRPSEILQSVGIENKPLKLYGNKLLAKMKKHGFNASDLKDLPNAINDPIAIFEGNRPDSFSVLTEINIGGNNVLAIVETGKGTDIDFNVIASAYGKTKEGIANWINDGKLLYSNKEKAPDYLRIPAPIAGAQNNQGSNSKYNKFSDQKQGLDEKNVENSQEPPKKEPPSEAKEPQGEAPQWHNELPDNETFWQEIWRRFVDERSPFKRLEEVLGTKESFYKETDASYGKITEEMKQVIDKLEKIGRIIKARKLDYKFVENFIESLHTKERNKAKFEAEGVENGSGHSDEWADEIQGKFKALPASEKDAIKAVLGDFREISDSIMEDYVKSGLWSKEKKAELKKLYPNYVPLRGLPKHIADLLARGGTPGEKGLTAKPDNKKAKGRKSAAENIIPQIIALKEQSIIRARRNMNLKKLRDMFREKPNDNFVKIDPPESDTRPGNDIEFYENGEKHIMRFYTLEGKRMAEHILGLDQPSAGAIINFIGALTRFRAQTVTTYSPKFTVNNFRRDYIHAVTMGFVRHGGKVAWKLLYREIPNLIKLFANDIGLINESGKVRQEWREQGGQIGITQSINYNREIKRLASVIKKMQRRKYDPRKIWGKIIEIFEVVNQKIEENTRIVTYQALVEKGMSKRDAIAAAKNITINFNRFGTYGRNLNKVYMFSNANIQGAAQIFEALTDKDPAVRKRAKAAFAFYFGIGFIRV